MKITGRKKKKGEQLHAKFSYTGDKFLLCCKSCLESGEYIGEHKHFEDVYLISEVGGTEQNDDAQGKIFKVKEIEKGKQGGVEQGRSRGSQDPEQGQRLLWSSLYHTDLLLQDRDGVLTLCVYI